MLSYIISYENEINVDVEEHEFFSFDILHKTDLNIYVIENNKVVYKNYIINNACRYGHIQVLEWFKNSGYEFEYDEQAIRNASYFGHIQVLEWFKNSGYEFKYNKYTIISACCFEHIKVLEWFKNSGYKLKYDEDVIVWASIDGHLQVLELFKNSGYEFKYNRGAFKTKFIKILKFYSYHFNIKKLIKWSDEIIFIKTIKFKTRNKYLKGYQKN